MKVVTNPVTHSGVSSSAPTPNYAPLPVNNVDELLTISLDIIN